MQKLKLPEYNPRVKEGEIFCLVRKKWVALTPEEWVRQHFLNLLSEHLGYPKGMMQLEKSFDYFKNQKRSDIAVLSPEHQMFLLVECKAPTVPIDEKVVNQIAHYNKVLDAQYLAITNGLFHFIWRREGEKYLQITEFPNFPKGS